MKVRSPFRSALAAALTLIGGVCGSAFGATIVHDAGRDLFLNARMLNVYTNRYGGVWSYMKAKTRDGDRTLLPAKRNYESTATDSSGSRKIRLERGLSDGTDNSPGNPTIAVNPGKDWDSTSGLTASGYPVIEPGQVSMHSGPFQKSSDFQCAVIRFEVPRDGSYAVTAKSWHQNSGKTASSLVINGKAVNTKISSGSSDKGTNDLSRAAARFAAGDLIEFVLDGADTYGSNATGVKFCIEEDAPAIEEAADGLRANVQQATRTNPWSGEFGSWTALSADSKTGSTRTALTTYTRSTQGGGLTGFGENNGHPSVTLQPEGKFTWETTSGKPSFTWGYALHPDEFLCFPGATKPLVLRWKPTKSGSYDIGLTVRDVQCQNAADTKTGADILVLQDGVQIASQFVSLEKGPLGATVYLPRVQVFSGQSIEIMVDAKGGNDSDATAVSCSVVRRVDPGYDAAAAMKANMTSGSPAAAFSFAGANWTVGCLNGGFASPVLSSYIVLRDVVKGSLAGFGNTVNTSPYWCVNTADVDATGIAGSVGMMVAHPGSNLPTAMSFVAPEKGVYSVSAWFKDVDPDTASSAAAGAGVDVRILVRNQYAAGDTIVADPVASIPLKPMTSLSADRLYLNEGDQVVLGIAPRSTHNNDQTGVRAWISRDEAAAVFPCVNIDLDGKGAGADPVTFAEPGRIGWGSGWNGLLVRDGVSSFESTQLERDDGTPTGVQLVLARDKGDIAADAGNAGQTNDLVKDGVVSEDPSDGYSFTVKGLLPNTAYEFCLFGTGAAFSVGGVGPVVTAETWMTMDGDCARISAVSDANGVVTGTFAAAGDGAAYWGGLQVAGAGFGKFKAGLAIILR